MSGTEISQLRGHTKSVTGLAFSPDSKILSSASRDRTIRLWDMNSGNEISVIPGQSDIGGKVAFSSNGKTLFSWDQIGGMIIKTWDLSSIYDAKQMKEKIAEIQKKYLLKLVDLELKPLIPPKNLYGQSQKSPSWPPTHQFHWMLKARQGDDYAMLQLGIIHLRDDEFEQAGFWFQKAAAKGNAEAKLRLQWLPKQQSIWNMEQSKR